MATEVFRARIRTAAASQGLGCLWAGAIIPAVVVVMNLALLGAGKSMTSSLEQFVRYSIPVGVVLVVAFAAAAIVYGKRSARELVVRRDGDRLALSITPDVELDGPFEVAVGWDRIPGGKGMKLLWCDITKDDQLLCRLSNEIGSLHSAPRGWPQAPAPMDRPAAHGGYSLSEIAQLADLLRA